MGGFPIDFVPKGAVHLSVYVDVQKWEVTCFFCFHGELYFVVNPNRKSHTQACLLV